VLLSIRVKDFWTWINVYGQECTAASFCITVNDGLFLGPSCICERLPVAIFCSTHVLFFWLQTYTRQNKDDWFGSLPLVDITSGLTHPGIEQRPEVEAAAHAQCSYGASYRKSIDDCLTTTGATCQSLPKKLNSDHFVAKFADHSSLYFINWYSNETMNLKHKKPKWHLGLAVLRSSPQCPYTLQWVAPSTSKLPLPMKRPGSNTCFLWPTRVSNGIFIGSAVLQGSQLWQTDRQTDRPRLVGL